MQQQSLSRHAPRFGLVVALLALGFTLGLAPAMAATAPSTPFGAVISGKLTATGPGTFQLAGSGISTNLGATREAGSVQITNVDSNGVITDVLLETLTAA